MNGEKGSEKGEEIPYDPQDLKSVIKCVPPGPCGGNVWENGAYRACKRPVVYGYNYCQQHLPHTEKKAIKERENRELSKWFQKHATDIQRDRKKLYNLDHQIAMLKALVDMLIENLQQHLSKSKKDGKEGIDLDTQALKLINQLRDAVEAMSKVAERIHKIEEGEKIRLDITGVNLIAVQIVQAVQRHVKDRVMLEAIATDIQGIVEG